MRKVFTIIIILILSSFFSLPTLCQPLQLHPYKFKGYFIGFSFNENTLTNYKPIYFLADFTFPLPEKKSAIRRKNFFNFYIEPQINMVFTNRPMDIETGIASGLRYNIPLSPQLYWYHLLGTGPHYFSARTNRQVKGFVFSSSFATGFFSRIQKQKHLFIDIRLQFRHMSNAGIKHPNGGINTFNLLFGFTKNAPASSSIN